MVVLYFDRIGGARTHYYSSGDSVFRHFDIMYNAQKVSNLIFNTMIKLLSNVLL
jgi:hypothetical protein